MTIWKRHLAVLWIGMGALVVLTGSPRPTSAQCAMTGGGGHDHSATHAQRTTKPSGAHKKMQQSIDRLLSDDQGRAMLADALLNDRAFVQDFIQRLAAVPEWRDMTAREVGGGPTGGPAGAPKPEAPRSASYVCPMHADVMSTTPASCPKCGMDLVRRPSDGR